MGPIYHLLEGICANGYPFAHIPNDNWYMGPLSYLPELISVKESPFERENYYLFSRQINQNKTKKGRPMYNLSVVYVRMDIHIKWGPCIIHQ